MRKKHREKVYPPEWKMFHNNRYTLIAFTSTKAKLDDLWNYHKHYWTSLKSIVWGDGYALYGWGKIYG